MNPVRVTATNYRTFEHLDLEIPTGCIAVIGDNGAGKSSIINAIDVALFAGRGELPALLTSGEQELEITLEFDHADEMYRIRRRYRGKATLDLERLVGLQWEPLTRETTDATQQLIEQILGLSRTTFRASSFLAQGDGAAFTEASPRDRKAILAQILGLEIYDRLLDRARADIRLSENEVTRSSTLIAGCEATIATKAEGQETHRQARARVSETGVTLAEAERELELAHEELTKAATARETVRAAEAELQAAVEALSRAREAHAAAAAAAEQLDGKQVELAELAGDAARVAELEELHAHLVAQAAEAQTSRRQRDELARQIESRELARGRTVERGLALHADAAALRGKADHLDAHIDEAARCDRCQQALGAEAAARAAESYRAEALALDEQSAQLDVECEQELHAIAGLHEQLAAIVIVDVEDPAPVALQLAASRRASEEHVRLTEQIRQLAEIAERVPALGVAVMDASELLDAKQNLVDAAKAVAGDVAVVEAKVGRWRVAVDESRRLLDQRNADVVRAQQVLERVAEAETQLVEQQREISAVLARLDVLKLAERAYGRDGIPALIVENAAIPQIELEANRILGELGGATADCRIELHTQRALKSSDQLRETLDIVIRTMAGDRPYETFSGGERTRLNLALRIALARLLAHRRGAESRLLAIDEPEFLDEAGVARLADVLRGLAGDFDRVLLVSHHPTLAASFDQTIAVTKSGDRSHADAGLLEAVAA